MLNTGRRWGKTRAGAQEAFKQTTLKPETVGFIVAPTYWHTQKCWREFLSILSSLPKQVYDAVVADINITDRHIQIRNQGHISHVWFKSADNPDSLRSEGLNWLWIDECAEIKEEAWILALRPALMDRKGIAWFTTTPKGHNWFFQLWTRGQDAEQTDYESWLYPSVANPYLDPKEIEVFSRDMPEFAYRQEILGEFMEDIGSVFRGVDSCINGSLEGPQASVGYVAGVDLAKHTDYTVICTLDNNGHLVNFDRFGEIDWVLQKRRIIARTSQYNGARTLLDSTGIGDPIYDDLRRAGLTVEGYKFTNASKADLIENLSIMIEQHKISYPNIPELINELKLFGYTTTRGGTIQYSAPEGYHDDCVIALALAAWMIRRGSKPYSIGHIPW